MACVCICSHTHAHEWIKFNTWSTVCTTLTAWHCVLHIIGDVYIVYMYMCSCISPHVVSLGNQLPQLLSLVT